MMNIVGSDMALHLIFYCTILYAKLISYFVSKYNTIQNSSQSIYIYVQFLITA